MSSKSRSDFLADYDYPLPSAGKGVDLKRPMPEGPVTLTKKVVANINRAVEQPKKQQGTQTRKSK